MNPRVAEALSRLKQHAPRLSGVVALRLAGLTESEVAETLGVPLRSVKRDWILAKACLYADIGLLSAS